MNLVIPFNWEDSTAKFFEVSKPSICYAVVQQIVSSVKHQAPNWSALVSNLFLSSSLAFCVHVIDSRCELMFPLSIYHLATHKRKTEEVGTSEDFELLPCNP